MNNLYAKKWDNLDEMDKLIKTQNLPRVNNKKQKNMNRSITSKEIESVIKTLLKKNVLGMMVSVVNYTNIIPNIDQINECDTPH